MESISRFYTVNREAASYAYSVTLVNDLGSVPISTHDFGSDPKSASLGQSSPAVLQSILGIVVWSV